MAYDVDSGDDDAAQAEAERIAATIAERRFRLRAFCDRVLDALEAIPMPETFLEADRAARAAQSCDKMVVQIHSEPKTVTESPSERAPREASVRPRRGHDDPDDDAADDEDDWRHQPIFDPETGEMLYKSYWHKALVEKMERLQRAQAASVARGNGPFYRETGPFTYEDIFPDGRVEDEDDEGDDAPSTASRSPSPVRCATGEDGKAAPPPPKPRGITDPIHRDALKTVPKFKPDSG